MEAIQSFDQWIFFIVNHDLHSTFGDWLMPIITARNTWFPLYIGLLIYVGYRFKTKVLLFLLASVLCIGIADTVSSKIIKKNVERLRPCNNPAMKEDVLLLTSCGSGYSFTSSHATNHFALGVFWLLVLGPFMKKWKWMWVFWAGSIAFSRVYVGVHYPIDVTIGAIIGALIGLFVYRLYLKTPMKQQLNS